MSIESSVQPVNALNRLDFLNTEPFIENSNVYLECMNYSYTYSKSVEAQFEVAFERYQQKSLLMANTKEVRDILKTFMAKVATIPSTTGSDGETIDGTLALPEQIVHFVETEGLFIMGVYEENKPAYSANGGWSTSGHKYSEKDAQSIYEALDQFSTRLTDPSGTEQLSQQRMMQALSMSYLMLNQLQTVWNEMMKTIVQSIR